MSAVRPKQKASFSGVLAPHVTAMSQVDRANWWMADFTHSVEKSLLEVGRLRAWPRLEPRFGTAVPEPPAGDGCALVWTPGGLLESDWSLVVVACEAKHDLLLLGPAAIHVTCQNKHDLL